MQKSRKKAISVNSGSSSGGGGGGNINGSISVNQIAYGSASNTINGNNNFTYTPTPASQQPYIQFGSSSQWQGTSVAPFVSFRNDVNGSSFFSISNENNGSNARVGWVVQGEQQASPASNARYMFGVVNSSTYTGVNEWRDAGVIVTGGDLKGGMWLYNDDGPMNFANNTVGGTHNPSIHINPYTLVGVPQSNPSYVGILTPLGTDAQYPLDVYGDTNIRGNFFSNNLISNSTTGGINASMQTLLSQNAFTYHSIYNTTNGTSSAASTLYQVGSIYARQILLSSSNTTYLSILPGTSGGDFLTFNGGNGNNSFAVSGNFGHNFYVDNNTGTFFRAAFVPKSGGLVIGNGSSALATTATDGFLYIPTCAGTPIGVPTTQPGTVPMVFDATNNKLYIYKSGWKGGTTPGAFI